MSERRKRAGLMEMATLVGDEARRIRITQDALVELGELEKAATREIRRAEVFEDLERLIYAIMPVREQVHKLLAPVIAAMATADQYPKKEPEPPVSDPENEEQSTD